MASVNIVNAGSRLELEELINMRIANEEIMDIKFCVNADIHSSMGGGSYSSGANYYAMIIYAD